MKKQYIFPTVSFEEIETNGIMDINTSGGTKIDSGMPEENPTPGSGPGVTEEPGDGSDLAKGTGGFIWDDEF